MSIKKTLYVRGATNPLRCNLGHDVREVDRLELKYFRMTRVDMTALPDYLFISLNANSSLYTNGTLHARSEGIPQLSSDKQPLYFELERKYNDGVNPDVQYDVIHGKQISGVTWEITNSSTGNVTDLEIYLYDETGNLVTLPAGATIAFTFHLVFRLPSHLVPDWRTNQLFVNHLNG